MDTLVYLQKLIHKEKIMSETVPSESVQAAPSPLKAQRVVYACDQGHYGSTTCSNCNKDIEQHFHQCPQCGAIFENKACVMGGFGGSDF